MEGRREGGREGGFERDWIGLRGKAYDVCELLVGIGIGIGMETFEAHVESLHLSPGIDTYVRTRTYGRVNSDYIMAWVSSEMGKKERRRKDRRKFMRLH